MDVNKIRNDFPVLRSNPNLAYLDSGAMALKPDCVIDAVDDYYRRLGVNVHRGVYGLSYRQSAIRCSCIALTCRFRFLLQYR